MTLTLTVTSYAGESPPAPLSVTLGAAGGSIGRALDCDWVLADPIGTMSKRHCRIDMRDGQYRVTDTSRNGVFVNSRGTPIGQGNSAPLHHGDTLYVGDYQIAVWVERPGENEGLFGTTSGVPQTPAESGDMAPIAPLFPDLSSGSTLRDIEPPRRPPARAAFPDHDHVPAEQAAFRPPDMIPTPETGDRIPDGWDFTKPDGGLGLAPAATEANQARVPAKPIFTASPPAAGGITDSRALQAFLEGAGLPPDALGRADAEAVLREAGQRLRQLTAGLRKLLAARAQIKAELRVEQTMIAAADNNPLKVSVSDDEAVRALLQPPRPGYLPPGQAIDQGVRDMQAHELALLAGARSAVGVALDQFDPALLMRQEEASLVGSLMPGARKARYWELFEAQFRRVRGEAEGDAHGLLARALARAYEEQDRNP